MIRLGKPSPFLLMALGPSESPMVPRHLYEGVDPATPPGPPLHVGTGPFVLKEWVRGSHAVLERNPNYWDKPKPYLDRVIIRFMPDAAARAAGFEAGDIDLGGLSPVPLSDMERFKADRRFTVDTRSFAYSGNQNQLLFNLDSEPMKNRKLREAIAHALDLDAIAQTVFYGYALPSPSPVSVALKPFHNPEVKARPFDLALANRLLDEAGLPRGANGMRIQLRLTYNPFVDPRFADFIRQSLRRVGIDAVVQNYEFAAYVKAVYTDRAFDMTLESLVNAFDPTVGVQRVYWSKNFRIGLPFSNASHYAERGGRPAARGRRRRERPRQAPPALLRVPEGGPRGPALGRPRLAAGGHHRQPAAAELHRGRRGPRQQLRGRLLRGVTRSERRVARSRDLPGAIAGEPRVERVVQPVAHEVEREHRHDDGEARHRGEEPGGAQELAARRRSCCPSSRRSGRSGRGRRGRTPSGSRRRRARSSSR